VPGVNRRVVLATGVLLAAATLSSCSTFSRTETAAEVDGVRLSRTELNTLTGDATDGDAVRKVIGDWLRLAVLGGDVNGVTSPDDLATRREAAIQALSEPFIEEGRPQYELGLDGSPLLCLGAIPLAAGADTAPVLADIEGGMSWADAAQQYSADPSFAANGGLVLDQNGNNCLSPDGFNPDLLATLSDAGASVGTPVTVDVGGAPAVVLLRPFDDLSTTDKASLVSDQVANALIERLDAVDIYVNPRFGRWDTASVSVLPLDA
jgi:hypothetical protein